MSTQQQSRIIVTGGGTAGHVMPVISIAEEINKLQPKVSIRFIGQKTDARSMAIVSSCKAIEKSYAISAGKLRRFHGRGLVWYIMHPSIVFKNFIDIFRLILGIVQSIVILLRWRPDVVFVKGGFVGLPVGLAAAILKIKIITHDSDAIPGLTNRILSRFAATSAVALPEKYYSQYYKREKVIQTGVPINSKYFSNNSVKNLKHEMNIDNNSKVLSVIGGSLGAVRMNNAVMKLVPSLLDSYSNLKIIWSTGDNQYKEISTSIEKLGLKSRVHVKPFFGDLDEVFGVSDLVISRAGATTIAELAASKKACIFIPNPVLTGGHQSKNADILTKNNAAVVITENDLDHGIGKLKSSVEVLLKDKAKRTQLGDNLSKFADSKATSKLAAVILGEKI
jgi:UDP-N-acetylglucosamine--N-acetylmuramyl-(pentapeptide) pyrophosphoryl-undecaprenol N-acetylglucosamine transferase